MMRLGRKHGKRKLNNEGLTLVEVMISVLVFSIMITPIVTQLNTLMKSNSQNKLSQAETDYATQVMEQFKEGDSDTVDIETDEDGNYNLSGGYASTKAGYKVDISDADDGIYTYIMDGVTLDKGANGMDSTDTISSKFTSTTTKQTDKYRVEVKMDASYYAVSGDASADAESTAYTYKNPNDTSYYNLQNLDDRYCVMIREDASNYDSKAASDLVDAVAKNLKLEYPERYNQWLNGVDVLNDVDFVKKTYIKMRYDNGKYYATVILSYSCDKYKDVDGTYPTVSYVLMNEKEYDEKETGYAPPSIYIFYNQYVQQNIVSPNTDNIIIDNSGLAVNGKIPKSKRLKCYLIKGQTVAGSSGYTVYTRKTAEENGNAGDEIYDGVTYNESGSQVIMTNNNGQKIYHWPWFIVDASDSMYDTEAEINALDAKLGASHATITYIDPATIDTDNPKEITKYAYQNVDVPSSVSGAEPDTALYDKTEGDGYLSYYCEDENAVYPTGTSLAGQKLGVGALVYQDAPNEYVWPDGSKTTTEPDRKSFTICQPTKKYDSSVATSIFMTEDSIQKSGTASALSIYTNLDLTTLVSSVSAAFSNYDAVKGVEVSTGIENGVTDTPTYVKVKEFENNVLYSLDDDVAEGKNRLYHLTLTLYKESADGSTETKVMTMESGRED